MLKKAIIRTRRAGLSQRGMAPKRENSLVVPASTATATKRYGRHTRTSHHFPGCYSTMWRQKVNFSEWQRPQDESQEAAESVADGEMPPRMYTLLHPEARLSSAERSLLIRGLQATLGTETRGLNGH